MDGSQAKSLKKLLTKSAIPVALGVLLMIATNPKPNNASEYIAYQVNKNRQDVLSKSDMELTYCNKNQIKDAEQCKSVLGNIENQNPAVFQEFLKQQIQNGIKRSNFLVFSFYTLNPEQIVDNGIPEHAGGGYSAGGHSFEDDINLIGILGQFLEIGAPFMFVFTVLLMLIIAVALASLISLVLDKIRGRKISG